MVNKYKDCMHERVGKSINPLSAPPLTNVTHNNISNYGLVKKGANTSFIIFTIIIVINIIIIIINTFTFMN